MDIITPFLVPKNIQGYNTNKIRCRKIIKCIENAVAFAWGSKSMHIYSFMYNYMWNKFRDIFVPYKMTWNNFKGNVS